MANPDPRIELSPETQQRIRDEVAARRLALDAATLVRDEANSLPNDVAKAAFWSQVGLLLPEVVALGVPRATVPDPLPTPIHWEPPPITHDHELREALQELVDSGSEGLSTWETNFVVNVLEIYTGPLSEAQQAKAQEIIDRHG